MVMMIMASNSAALELYLKCVEKVNFEEKNRSGQNGQLQDHVIGSVPLEGRPRIVACHDASSLASATNCFFIVVFVSHSPNRSTELRCWAT